MSEAAECSYAEAINRAAWKLVAMSFDADLRPSLIEDIETAVAIRGGRIDGRWLAKFVLGVVFDAIADRTMAILSAALRERLPGIADEMDEKFGDSLRRLLASFALVPYPVTARLKKVLFLLCKKCDRAQMITIKTLADV